MTNEKFVRKWIQALRSGEYKQAQNKLCNYNGITGKLSYCCLGVAADLLVKGGDFGDGVEWEDEQEVAERYSKYGNETKISVELLFPSSNPEGDRYAIRYAIEDELPIHLWQLVDPPPTVTQGRLVEMNDGVGPDGHVYTFKEIADYLERELDNCLERMEKTDE